MFLKLNGRGDDVDTKRRVHGTHGHLQDAMATTTPADMIENEETNRSIPLSRDDYLIIVTWMEVEDNFAAVHGSGDKIRIGGKPKVKKIDAFRALSKHVISKTDNDALRAVGLTGRNMQQRWKTYMRRFKRTLKASHTETGMGISRRELAEGMSIPQKLEQMCPHFSRMKTMFGLKANVTPSATVELGLPDTDESDVVASDVSDHAEDSSFKEGTSMTDGWSDGDLTFSLLAQSTLASMATPTPPASLDASELTQTSANVPTDGTAGAEPQDLQQRTRSRPALQEKLSSSRATKLSKRSSQSALTPCIDQPSLTDFQEIATFITKCSDDMQRATEFNCAGRKERCIFETNKLGTCTRYETQQSR